MNEGKKKAHQKLKTARGQIDGILKMIEEDRYCVDVSNQILAVLGLLKKANNDILGGHLRSCVKEAILEGEDAGEEKIEEVMKVLEKYNK